MTRWVVVGGGSAGCVVAARLSEFESNDVTLLEAGPDHGRGSSSVGPAPAHASASRWAEVVRRAGDPPSPYLQGFGLGGSSLVNGSIVVGPAGDWTTGHALPVEPAVVGPVGAAVVSARSDAAAVGVIARGGVRVSAADAYLRPVLDRPNLHVRTDARVDRIVVDGRRAVGVVVNGAEIAADRVVVCAGAIESPAILLRSNVDTPGVGVGLQDHVGVSIGFDLHAIDDAASSIGVTVERLASQLVVLERLADAPTMGALLAGHLAVASRGVVMIGDDGATVATLEQLTTAADRDGLAAVAADAIGLVRELVAADVIGAAYVDEHGTSVDELGDEAALRRWLPEHLGGYHHVAGSCHQALTADGWLHGYEGIAVCDAGALAGAPARNPYLTVIRHAETTVARWIPPT